MARYRHSKCKRRLPILCRRANSRVERSSANQKCFTLSCLIWDIESSLEPLLCKVKDADEKTALLGSPLCSIATERWEHANLKRERTEAPTANIPISSLWSQAVAVVVVVVVVVAVVSYKKSISEENQQPTPERTSYCRHGRGKLTMRERGQKK